MKNQEWVQITNVVLPAGKRAPQVPEDTQKTDLRMWTKGFLDHKAKIGDEITVTTVTGREVSGQLYSINPKYTHTYGDFIPELLTIQVQLKNILKEVNNEE